MKPRHCIVNPEPKNATLFLEHIPDAQSLDLARSEFGSQIKTLEQ